MENLEFKVSLPKHAVECSNALADLIVKIIAEVNDKEGWSTLDDLPGIGMALVEMLPKLSGFAQLTDEAKQDPSKFFQAWVIAGFKVADVLLKDQK